jgi:hypothetical protein
MRINELVTVRKGKKQIRSSKPKGDDRTYFVWRLARFHGGIDVTLPITATTYLRYDPYEKILDEFASVMAMSFFGSDLKGAIRWGKALGMI